MDSITYEELNALFTSFRREALHLEMRDSYGTAVEIPHLRKWEDGEPDDTDWASTCGVRVADHCVGRADLGVGGGQRGPVGQVGQVRVPAVV